MDSFGISQSYTDALQNEIINNAINNSQVGDIVTIIRLDGTVSHGIITAPGLVHET